MYCTNCGKPVREDDNFCANCGHRLQPINESDQQNIQPVQLTQAQITTDNKSKRNILSAGNICLSILGLLLCLWGFVQIAGFIGIPIWFFLIALPYIIFVIIYASINNNK